VLSSLECVTLGDSAWNVTTGGLGTARFGHGAALTSSGSEVVVYGGTDARGRALKTVEVREDWPGFRCLPASLPALDLDGAQCQPQAGAGCGHGQIP
jgi:hypothetical protein